jgi:hypothetical protein
MGGDPYPGWDNEGVGQLWDRWVRNGWIHKAHLMCYSTDVASVLDERVMNNLGWQHYVDLVSITPSPNYFGDGLSVEQWENNVDAVLERGFDLALFDLLQLRKRPEYIQVLADRPPDDKPPTCDHAAIIAELLIIEQAILADAAELTGLSAALLDEAERLREQIEALEALP